MSDSASTEVPVDAALARRLIAGQFPRWADLPVSAVPTPGVDNATFRLGDRLSVRLPRFPRWVGQVAREQRWLPILAPRLPLRVPEPVAMGRPADGYPFPWSVYRWLEGEVATPEGLVDPAGAAADLAGFVNALRRIDPAGGPGPQWSNAFRGVPMGDERDSLASEARVRPKIAALRGVVDTAAVTAVWEAALAAPAWEGPPTWVHGDLAVGNVLSVEGRLSAVIDFGTLAVGDPAVDLLPAWKLLPAAGRPVFRAALDVDDAMWARGRGWALAASLPVPDDPCFTDPTRIQTALGHLDELVADFRRHGR